jgi:hypothetical protein
MIFYFIFFLMVELFNFIMGLETGLGTMDRSAEFIMYIMSPFVVFRMEVKTLLWVVTGALIRTGLGLEKR